ncbi:hypothetical protein [Roseibium sp. MMSF_3544]|uniref:hypothetical protein n=1 Tax=unclassified Roseibium TaxID=2629323 RepID=UPI00273DE2F6|nr:hypothetical protein [Roseibium sp. MMSF_3544]
MNQTKTMAERAEVACIELYGDDFQIAQPEVRQSKISAMVRALEAAYPELHAAPPQAWIAPWTTTAAMDKAVEGDLYDWDHRFHLDWEAAREAYLSEKTKSTDGK